MRNTIRAARRAQLSDAAREVAITHAHRALITARDLRSKFGAWKVMRDLIRGRSAEAIARLEHERGLAKPLAERLQ